MGFKTVLYRAETLRTTMTMATAKSTQTFVNNCLRRIIGDWLPETTSNEQLWQRTCQMPGPGDREIQHRCWRWTGRTTRKPVDSYTTSLNLEPRGRKEKRTTEKHTAPRFGSTRQGNRVQMEAIVGICSGPELATESCWLAAYVLVVATRVSTD